MLRKLRSRMSYANVMATTALFVALGGAGYAATKLPNNSVGTKQLRKGAVTSPKLAQGSVTGSKVKAGSLTGAVINSSTLGNVPSATHATSAGSADSATHAGSADSATHAGSADSATHAGSADAATHAGSADTAASLGGVGSSGYLRYGSTIPSGVTITGAFVSSDRDDVAPRAHSAGSFPLPAPANLTDAQINFASSTVGGDDDPACTGTTNVPTAPPGKVCLYVTDTGNYTDATATGVVIGQGQSSRYGFGIDGPSSPGGPGEVWVRGTWAYTAP
jgi:hypothetical protein